MLLVLKDYRWIKNVVAHIWSWTDSTARRPQYGQVSEHLAKDTGLPLYHGVSELDYANRHNAAVRLELSVRGHSPVRW